MRLLYTLAIYCYTFGIKVASLFNQKAKLWVDGRKNFWKKLPTIDKNKKVVWFHCASLGEFEQGRPIIELLKKKYSEIYIVLSFFSPSGYEIRKNYNQVDHICYLPADTPRNAKKFIDKIHPQLAVFIKYEFWFNYLKSLKRQQIPLIVASANIRTDHYFFKWYGKWFLKQIQQIEHIFIQRDEHLDFLHQKGFSNITVGGDTRFDRVMQVCQNPNRNKEVEQFIQSSIIFIGGSLWKKDLDVLIPVINNNYQGLKYIIATHEINQTELAWMQSQIKLKSILYSEIKWQKVEDAQVLIIDTIGILSHLYQYANMAFIGGGFGKGIHNILEAAVFGMPILIGPNYHKFIEANDLIKLGGAFCIASDKELAYAIENILGNYKLLKFTSIQSKQYVEQRIGATLKVIEKIEDYLWAN